MKKSIVILSSAIILALLTWLFLPKQKTKIALQPISKVKSSYINLVKAEIETFYFADVEILPKIEFPNSCYYPPRKRYRADKTIAFLEDFKPEKFDKIIGITEKDISTTKGKHYDYGIMGLAYMPGESGIISTYRCKRGVSEKIAKDRIVKNALHELGHTFGLAHCSFSPTCLMNDAKGTVKTAAVRTII